jgi:hypothetical protein
MELELVLVSLVSKVTHMQAAGGSVNQIQTVQQIWPVLDTNVQIHALGHAAQELNVQLPIIYQFVPVRLDLQETRFSRVVQHLQLVSFNQLKKPILLITYFYLKLK